MRRAKMPIQETTNSLHQPLEAPKWTKLPPLAINSLTQNELQTVIPKLVQLVFGNRGQLNSKNKQPEWWPPDVPWSASKNDTHQQQAILTDTLRSIVRNCYKHVGQENLLKYSERPDSPYRSDSPIFSDCTSTMYSPLSGYTGHQMFSEIYICYFCEEEFTDRDEMCQHQAKCKERSMLPEMPLTPPHPPSDILDKPPRLSPVVLNLNHSLSKTTKDVYVKSINLLPKQKADKIRARSRKSLEVECEEIDVSEPQTPISPTTPRTPKSLISQLSREDSNCNSKKRLSYSEVDNEDKESVISGCSEDSEDRPTNSGKSLLSIDISSLLGQRIQRHVKLESAIQVVKDSEVFCRTPTKNQFYEKLRNRTVSYPVSYKPKRKMATTQSHSYCFTSKQRKEHKSRLRTGLNKKGRDLLRNIVPCKVVLARLTRKEFKKFLGKSWYKNNIQPKKTKVKPERSIFPKEPVLKSTNIDQLLGLKRRSDLKVKHNLSPLSSLAAVVSEDENADASKQKLTLYRCLLYDMANTQKKFSTNKSSQSKQKPLKKRGRMSIKSGTSSCISPVSTLPIMQMPPVSPPESLVDYKLSSYVKVSSPDDSISIISIESDEESLKSGCCIGCRNRKQCHCMSDSSRVSSPEMRVGGQINSKEGQIRSAGSLSFPLHILPSCSCPSSPQMSPNGSLCSSHSDMESSQRSLSVSCASSSDKEKYFQTSNACPFKKPVGVKTVGKQVEKQESNSKVLSPSSQNKANVLVENGGRVVLSHLEEANKSILNTRVQRGNRSTFIPKHAKKSLNETKSMTASVMPVNTVNVKRRSSVKPIIMQNNDVNDKITKEKNKRYNSAENSPRKMTRKSSLLSLPDSTEHSLERSEKRKMSQSCHSCVACNTLLLDKSVSPNFSPKSPNKLGQDILQIKNLIPNVIQTRQRTGSSSSSPFKVVNGSSGGVLLSSPSKHNLVFCDTESAVSADLSKGSPYGTEARDSPEPSRRSKRLISGSTFDTDNPRKLRKIETV